MASRVYKNARGASETICEPPKVFMAHTAAGRNSILSKSVAQMPQGLEWPEL
jgi:hypothetical protein